MHQIEDIAVGQVVSFTFTTVGRGSVRHCNLVKGDVVKVGAKLSINVLDEPKAHEFWRTVHVGKVKASASAVIPPLPE